MADSEKKLPPSSKKLRDARRDGKVVFSRDLSASIGGLAAFGALAGTGTLMLSRLSRRIASSLTGIADVARHDVTSQEMMRIVIDSGIALGAVVGPVAVAAAAAGLLTSLVQTQFLFAPRALRLNFGGLNPANGLSRLKPSRAGLDTLKAILMAAVIGTLAWKVVRGMTENTPHLAWADPLVVARSAWDNASRLMWQVGFALLAFGAGDYALQRWRLRESLKMTLQEVKDEAKEDSNPEIKSRIRRIQRDMHRKRMMQAVKTATVVITNPTHFAVALEYDRSKSPAPVVVAKGADNVAAKIREIARHHSVPIMENPPLARALFKECELGDTIPAPLFGAVAEVLAYLVRIKQLVL